MEKCYENRIQGNLHHSCKRYALYDATFHFSKIVIFFQIKGTARSHLLMRKTAQYSAYVKKTKKRLILTNYHN